MFRSQRTPRKCVRLIIDFLKFSIHKLTVLWSLRLRSRVDQDRWKLFTEAFGDSSMLGQKEEVVCPFQWEKHVLLPIGCSWSYGDMFVHQFPLGCPLIYGNIYPFDSWWDTWYLYIEPLLIAMVTQFRIIYEVPFIWTPQSSKASHEISCCFTLVAVPIAG